MVSHSAGTILDQVACIENELGLVLSHLSQHGRPIGCVMPITQNSKTDGFTLIDILRNSSFRPSIVMRCTDVPSMVNGV